jgi:thiol-disulfide isomerase/thioredoxin
MKLIVIVVCLFLILGCQERIPLFLNGHEGEHIPVFKLQKYDSCIVSSTDVLISHRPIFLLIFNPYCPYCRAEIKQLLHDKSNFDSQVDICLITRFPYKDLKSFYNEYELYLKPNIIIGKEYDDTLIHYFKPHGVPFMAFYDRNGALKGELAGLTDFNIIKQEFKSL